MKTNELPDIDQVEKFSDADENCLNDIRDVLKKHGKLNRFGVTLLHQHFPIADDEVLLETCDPETRTLTIQPVKNKKLNDPIATNWRLDIPGVMAYCQQVCQPEQDRDTGRSWHNKLHNPLPDPR